MKAKRLFLGTEEGVLYALVALLLLLSALLAFSMVGIIVVPFTFFGAVGAFMLARHLAEVRHAPTPRH
ncbi:hypothetical protein [Streptomyces sp. YIM S03343]